jgi:anti-sigma factor RsiW
MKYDAAALKEMIPLYINGRLSDSEMTAFEKALESDAALKQELSEFEEIAALYPDIEEEIPFPSSDRVFSRIMDNIDAQEKKAAISDAPGMVFEKLADFIRTTFFSPRVAWAVAAVQLVLLVTLVGTMPDEQEFKTLSSGQTTTATSERFNVVFREDAMEKDIRALLKKIDAGIVAGPLANGLYVIEARSSERPEEGVVNVLLNSKLVRLAEPNY